MQFIKESIRLTPTEIRKMAIDQTITENEKDELQTRGLNKIQEMEIEEQFKKRISVQEAQLINTNNRIKFLNNVKASFLSECLFKLYKESYFAPMTESDKTLAKNLVNRFIVENGAQNLINRFSTENLMLSEFARVTTKYYNMVLEGDDGEADCDEDGCKKFVVDTGITNDFLKELETVPIYDASKLIKERVSDSITEFIDTNILEKLEYEEIIKNAQELTQASKNESHIEEYNNTAKRKINEMKLSREKNILHCMVESLCKATLKDEALQERYMDGTKIDMDKIVEHTEMIYTMLEMVNTTNMCKVDEKYLNDFISSLA